MHEGFRRFSTVSAVFGIALVAVYLLRRDDADHYGMFELAQGEPFPSAQSQSVLEYLNDEFSKLTRSVIPAVVSIDTSTTIQVPQVVAGPFADSSPRSGRYTQPGLGSGVIVSKEGHVITNYHVIAGVDEIWISTNDYSKYLATVVGYDETSDIAVLRIETEEEIEFTPLPFADSDFAEVGHMVFAIGNPFGLSETVTRGIISAKQRYISDASPAVFQTDTVINPGNSGGPLINVRGEIVGINVALYAGQKDVRVWQGVGLAIPSNDVRESYIDIIENRDPSRGFLGVRVQELVRATPVEDNVEAGVLVDAIVPGSPAEQAGLLPGDILLEFGGESITTTSFLMRKIKSATVGSTVTLTVMRNDQPLTLTAVIGNRPNNTPSATDPGTPSSAAATEVRTGTGSFEENLGIHVRALTGYERRRIGMGPNDPGILVAEIDPDSPVGGILRPHDIITHANIYPIHTPDQLGEILQILPLDERAVLAYIRNGRTETMPVVPRGDR